MTEVDLEKLKYPIGKLVAPEVIAEKHIQQWISNLNGFPKAFEKLVQTLDDKQLDTPYRLNGWTVRQLVHHVPDSHTNAYIRFKWTLTEDIPLIKAYHEDRWGSLTDSVAGDIMPPIKLLYALHERWVQLMRQMEEKDWEKSLIHPETKKVIPLKNMLALYDWHSRHHYAHIENLIKKENWA
ncbi:MAG: YfiT family bacillithiol transferase [Bacteroidota bacterium]